MSDSLYSSVALVFCRYMGDSPYSNYTDLTIDVSAFKSTELLLIHGLADGKPDSRT